MGCVQPADVVTHFNNWPNEKGFDANYEQKTAVELVVRGDIPSYTAGVLYRTGPGRYKVDTEEGNTFRVSHWFDGFSQTHRFQLIASNGSQPGMRVFYNSRFSTDHLIEEVRLTGSLHHFTFGGLRDPCKAMYQKVQSKYEDAEARGDPEFSNIGVTLSVNMPGIDGGSANNKDGKRWVGIQNLYAKTDAAKFKRIDPETLEPLCLATQKSLHPELDGPLSGAHARSDPDTGDMYNYNLSFAPTPIYRIFHVSATSGEATILASFPGTPSYIHSLFLTEDYVILCVWNAHINPAAFANGSYVAGLQTFDASQPAKWYVVDRQHGQGLVATYDSRPFFCFHSCNAWQEPSAKDATKTDIVAECVIFEDSDVITKLYYEYLLSSSPAAQPCQAHAGPKIPSKIARFRLPSLPQRPVSDTQKATEEWTACESIGPELPTMNSSYSTRPHRYTYGVVNQGQSTFFDGIMKFDSQTKDVAVWSRHAHSPGEPIFVADPAGTQEDDGVLLSVVLDGMSGKSYLLCLDARTLEETGRAEVDGPVGFGFHGQHVAMNGIATGDY